MSYVCPVCRYDHLEDPPADHEICPCCGTEFGEDDYETTYEELRRRWTIGGMRWFSRHTQPPGNWDPARQLEIAASAK